MYRKILIPLVDSKRAVAKKKKYKSKLTSFEKLRRQAEKRLLERNVDLSNRPPEDINELIQEPVVH